MFEKMPPRLAGFACALAGNYFCTEKFMNRIVKTVLLDVCLNLLLAARMFAGPPFLTDDPEPVDYQHWEAYLFTMGDHSGSVYNVEGPAVELNYGVLPDTQLHLIVPMTTVGGDGAP